MALKSNIDPQSRGFYFAQNGDNLFDGTTLELPKLTIQAAIDATQDLIPIPSFGDIASVTAAQSGIFDETITLFESVQFSGFNTVINTSAAIAVTLESFANFEITSVTNNQASSICFKIDGQIFTGLTSLACRIFGSGSDGLIISGICNSIFATISQFTALGADTTCIKITATSNTPIDINTNTVDLGGSNSVFLDYDPQTSDDLTVVNVSSISDIQVGGAKSTGTKGIICRGGHLIVEAASIEAATVFEGIGGVSHVQAGDLIGNVLISGGRTTLESACLTGDLTIAVGAVLDTFILEHSGVITNNGTLNGIIAGVPFGTYRQKHEEQVVLNAFSTSTQTPTGTDILTQIEFGAAQGSGSDPVELSVAGAVTINQSDQYNVKIVLQYGRMGAAGSSAMVFFRTLIDGAQFGQSRYAELDNPNQAFPVQFSIPLDLTATEILTFEFWRDSAGFDAGSLIPQTPVLGGTNSAPSASIVLTRNRLVQPVD